MLGVIEFCDRRASAIDITGMTVDAFVQEASQHSELFVAVDTRERSAAVVVPEAVMDLVRRIGAPGENMVSDGLMAYLSRGQMTVAVDAPVEGVIREAADHACGAVVALEHDGSFAGVFIPENAARALPHAGLLLGVGSDVRRPLDRLEEAADFSPDLLIAAICAVDTVLDEFRSERLNLVAAVLHVCGRGHTIDRCPCAQHPDAPCNHRAVS